MYNRVQLPDPSPALWHLLLWGGCSAALTQTSLSGKCYLPFPLSTRADETNGASKCHKESLKCVIPLTSPFAGSKLLCHCHCHYFMVSDAMPFLSQGCAAPAQLFLRTNQTGIPNCAPPVLHFSGHTEQVLSLPCPSPGTVYFPIHSLE